VSLSTILAHGRAAAQARMLDACTIQHPTGVTTDDLTGVVTAAYATVYTGPCRVKQSGNGSATDGGEVTVAVLNLEVHVPVVGTEAVVHGDRVTITSAVNDTALVGRTFRVIAKPIRSEATARRISCEEVD
jgi:hypothetical protein